MFDLRLCQQSSSPTECNVSSLFLSERATNRHGGNLSRRWCLFLGHLLKKITMACKTRALIHDAAHAYPLSHGFNNFEKNLFFFQFFKHSKAKQVIYHFNESCNTETSVRKNSSEEKLPPFATKDTFLTTYVYQWDHEGVEIMHRFWRFHAADKQLQGIIWKTESNNSNRHRKVHGCRIWFKEPKTPR